MRRLVWLVMAFVLVIGACGGSDDDAGPGEDEDTAPPTTSTAPPTDDGDEDDSPPATTATTAAAEDETPAGGDDDTAAAEGIGRATVTIDGRTYRFGDTGFPALRCEPDMFGVFFVVLSMVDDSGAEVPDGGGLQLVLLQEGVDPNEVDQLPEMGVRLGAEEEWIANEEHIAERGLDSGTSQVDTYSIDGATASGTATLYEENSYFATTGGSADEVSVTQATFEVACVGG